MVDSDFHTPKEAARTYIYVLELESDKFYVGQSRDPLTRLETHFAGKGSVWTRTHKPLKIAACLDVGVIDYRAGEILENEHVIQLMKEHGWKNVRGGFFTNVCEKMTRGNLISHGHTEFFVNDEVAAKLKKRKDENQYFLFVLRLEGGKYFVGYSSDPERRVKKHFDGRGAAWTTLYKPLELTRCDPLGEISESSAAVHAKNEVIALMRKLGWVNVRGGAWVDSCEIETKRLLLIQGYDDLF